ncbi:hypothetical protein OUZ56_005494 [Daphnia magna]|uniref:Uncharacterized protein n=1 Tax=Daphnia magna TaxID=35525 RepID=A0ABQ9YSX8_9CRUS|nr:hypothetical protein OUZ56_005494 [Daphnia magna]
MSAIEELPRLVYNIQGPCLVDLLKRMANVISYFLFEHSYKKFVRDIGHFRRLILFKRTGTVHRYKRFDGLRSGSSSVVGCLHHQAPSRIQK